MANRDDPRRAPTTRRKVPGAPLVTFYLTRVRATYRLKPAMTRLGLSAGVGRPPSLSPSVVADRARRTLRAREYPVLLEPQS